MKGKEVGMFDLKEISKLMTTFILFEIGRMSTKNKNIAMNIFRVCAEYLAVWVYTYYIVYLLSDAQLMILRFITFTDTCISVYGNDKIGNYSDCG